MSDADLLGEASRLESDRYEAYDESTLQERDGKMKILPGSVSERIRRILAEARRRGLQTKFDKPSMTPDEKRQLADLLQSKAVRYKVRRPPREELIMAFRSVLQDHAASKVGEEDYDSDFMG